MIERRPGHTNEMMADYCQALINVLERSEKVTTVSGKSKKEVEKPKYKDTQEKLNELSESLNYYRGRKDSIELRPYQKQIVKQGLEVLEKHRFLYLAMEVRTGKTLTSLAIAEQMGSQSVLFVTKKKAISSIESDYEKLSGSYELTIINYESLHHIDDSFDLIIIDEAHCCFLGETLVDGKKIKDTGLGDYLNSFNFEKNIYEKRKVVNIYKNPLTENLVKIKCNGRQIVCTESHEVFTKRGWVKAGEILPDDELQIL